VTTVDGKNFANIAATTAASNAAADSDMGGGQGHRRIDWLSLALLTELGLSLAGARPLRNEPPR
jgi:hypothetical protein